MFHTNIIMVKKKKYDFQIEIYAAQNKVCKRVYTWMISKIPFVVCAAWIRYSGNPEAKIMVPKTIATVEIPKPQIHPLLSCIYTLNVKLTAPPTQSAKKRPLKKLDICIASLGSLSSNWSAPCDGKEAFKPALPKANK